MSYQNDNAVKVLQNITVIYFLFNSINIGKFLIHSELSAQFHTDKGHSSVTNDR